MIGSVVSYVREQCVRAGLLSREWNHIAVTPLDELKTHQCQALRGLCLHTDGT